MNGRFKVVWRRDLSERLLIEIVVRAMEQGHDVDAITRAVHTIDTLLALNPESRGESRGPFERVLIVSPLTVTFEVHEEERIVCVLELRYWLQRREGSE